MGVFLYIKLLEYFHSLMVPGVFLTLKVSKLFFSPLRYRAANFVWIIIIILVINFDHIFSSYTFYISI